MIYNLTRLNPIPAAFQVIHPAVAIAFLTISLLTGFKGTSRIGLLLIILVNNTNKQVTIPLYFIGLVQVPATRIRFYHGSTKKKTLQLSHKQASKSSRFDPAPT